MTSSIGERGPVGRGVDANEAWRQPFSRLEGEAIPAPTYSRANLGRPPAILELFQLIWDRRAWALIPPVIVLVLIAGLILLSSAVPLDPMIYPVH
jgi:hypothetical protein